MLALLVLYLVLGAAAGIVAGLFGIGGGLLIVPVLIFSFAAQGMPEAVLTHSAIATSLATIVVTSISSVRAHNNRGGVRWDLFKPLAVGIGLGVLVGVAIADSLSGKSLQMIFGIFACLIALQMAFNLKPERNRSKVPDKIELGSVGVFIGCTSSIFGIGGGALTVPYLTLRGVQVREAIGTAAACGFPIAVVGATAYIWAGRDLKGMPDWTVGYIYLPAFLGVALASSLFVKLGVKLAHTLPQLLVKKIFAIFLLLVGLRFLILNLIGD